MKTLLDEFDECLAGIAWNAWKELGVAGTERFYANCLIQPEELIILTAIISRHDPRLYDEALDWCSRFHECISVNRLRTLTKKVDTSASLSQFAADLNSISSANWPAGDEIARFAPKKVSGKSLLPPLEAPSRLMLRLRSVFGIGAKADILTHFLTRNGQHFSAPDLNEIGYSKKSLLAALDNLATAGILDATNVKNKKIYELSKAKELQVVIGKLPKIAPPWIKILQAIIAIRTALPEIQNSSKTTKGVIFRNCLIKIEPLLPVFISTILLSKPDFERDWKAILEIFKAFQQGNFFVQYEVYNDFDKIVIQLLRELYQVDDCVDGIEMIFDKKERSEKVYRECYQFFLNFVADLNVSLEQFLNFPFHKMMDEPLSDIAYRYSKERHPQLLEKIKQIQPLDRITNAHSAILQYQLFIPEFDALRQFIYTFRKRLEDLYFIRTDIHLLSLPSTLYKRHLVGALFSNDEIHA